MPRLEAIDLATKFWMQNHWSPWLDNIMVNITALGSRTVLALVTAFTLGLFLVVGRRRTAVFILLAVVGGMLLSDVSKALVGRERPEITHQLVLPPRDASFPSGHALGSAVVYLTLALVAAPHLPRRSLRRYVIASSLLVVVLVGVSRIYLGVHYLTDVLAGWAGGAAWALACRWIEDTWQPLRTEEEGSSTSPG